MNNRKYSWLLLINTLLIATLFLAGCGGEEEEKPDPASPTGHPDDRFGFAWASGFYQDAQNTGKENLAREAGATWDRWPFQWWFIEQPQGSYQLDEYTWTHPTEGWQGHFDVAEGVRRDEDNDLQLLGILNGWAPYAGYGLDEWRAYVDAIVTRFGDSVDAWEIGNEYELPLNANMTPELYYDVVAVTCEVLEDHDQLNKPILLGAPNDVAAIGTAALEAGISGRYDDSKGHIEQYRTIVSIMGQNTYCVNGISIHAYGRPVLSYWSAYWIYQRALGIYNS
jgi:hypothetical protein